MSTDSISYKNHRKLDTKLRKSGSSSWSIVSKCQVKLFTLIILGLLLSVLLLQLALTEADERDRKETSSSSPKVSLSLEPQASAQTRPEVVVKNVTKDNRSEQQQVKQNSKVDSDATRTIRELTASARLADPFEVSESQFVVYRERRTLERAPDGNSTNRPSVPPGFISYIASESSSPATLRQPSGALALNEGPLETGANEDESAGQANNEAASSNQGRTRMLMSELLGQRPPEVGRDALVGYGPAGSLADATTAAALAGALIGERVSSEMSGQQQQQLAASNERQQQQPDELDAAMVGTNKFWTGRPLEPQPDGHKSMLSDADEQQDDEPRQQERAESGNNFEERSSSDPSDSMPDSIESLMNSEPDGASDEVNSSDQQAATNSNNDGQAASEASKLTPLESSNPGSGEEEEPDHEDEAEGSRSEPTESPGQVTGLATTGNPQSKAVQTSGMLSESDLSAAAGHHYGKKKKKKKKTKKVYKVKKYKKKKKKKVVKKKKKVIVIKKKKKKKKSIKKKKYKVKKKKKKKHHHGKPDHGKYYMYAKVPKKKSWEFGFKKGNKKHWIERHEKGHKNKFKTKVKWYDKKSKGKGIHIWDYNHHDKKKKHHG